MGAWYYMNGTDEKFGIISGTYGKYASPVKLTDAVVEEHAHETTWRLGERRQDMRRILNWLFCGLSFGDWKWYPDPWKVNERVTGVSKRMSLWLRKRKDAK